jgi:hypothetical protein
MQGTTPPLISASTFSDNATIFVPCSAMDAYLAIPVWQFLDLHGLSHHVNLNATEGGSAQITATNCESSSVTIEANPTDCNRFKQWSDGNTDNPRTLTLTRDITLTAEFEEPKIYTVNISGDRICGYYYSGGCDASYWEEYYGTSFVQLFVNEGTSISVREEVGCGTWLGWSDGVTDNQRTIVITSDTTIYSIIEEPKYYSVKIYGESLSGSYEYEIEGCSTSWSDFDNESSLQLTMREGTTISFSEFYAFFGDWLGWSDGVTERDRTIVVTSDTTITSLF